VWKERKAILFDDSLQHEVVNNAEEDRIVLIVDVLRPMPAMPQYVNRLFSQTAIRYVYAKGVLKVSPIIWPHQGIFKLPIKLLFTIEGIRHMPYAP
jgi:aspartyl/asparaginyl beta-hydroxylase (cupin superfamily)